MKLLAWIARFIVPFAVLYTIGYFVSGFSALTIRWLILLTVLIVTLNWLALKLVGNSRRMRANRFAELLISFLTATVIIFTVTLAIQGGNVPLGDSLLAGAIIALLTAWLIPRNVAAHR